MTKEEKQLRKHKRCQKRRKHNHVNQSDVIRIMNNECLNFSQAKHQYRYGYFYNDYGEIKQVCDYHGHCDYPCNGDC